MIYELVAESGGNVTLFSTRKEVEMFGLANEHPEIQFLSSLCCHAGCNKNLLLPTQLTRGYLM